MTAKDALSALTGYTVGVGMILLFDRPVTRGGALMLPEFTLGASNSFLLTGTARRIKMSLWMTNSIR